MSSSTLVWIDHQEARIFDVAAEKPAATVVSAPKHQFHRHPKGPSSEHNHPSDAAHFFGDVTRALEGTRQILLVGPSSAKLQFLRFLGNHHPAVEARVVGIETVDHPTDGQLLAHAKSYFEVPSPRIEPRTPGV